MYVCVCDSRISISYRSTEMESDECTKMYTVLLKRLSFSVRQIKDPHSAVDPIINKYKDAYAVRLLEYLQLAKDFEEYDDIEDFSTEDFSRV